MTESLPLYLIRDFAVVLVSAAVAATLCKRIHLTPIVGYLLAGVIVGTPQITFVYVTDPGRVQLLSQLGLIFLMFSIGLGFRIQRFKQIGGGIVVATFIAALLVLTLTRLVASSLGFEQGPSLFLAAMFMVSSSAIIGKNLQSQGLLHKRAGQLALGITLCEDIVAIVLLAFLGSYAAMDSDSGGGGLLNLSIQVGSLFAFAALLLVPGLFFIPKLLKRVSRLQTDSHELEIIFVSAILFSMALLTLLSGYSLAFGSFLCGMIVAESSRGRQISESFAGLRDLFVAVFFVAIGMAVDITRFGDALGLIALGTILALALRPFAALVGMLVSCEEPEDAAKAGLSLVPIGEFSFVIANLGVATGILDSRFQVASVGIAFLTALLSPWISKAGSRWISSHDFDRIPVFGSGLQSYRNLWAAIGRRQDSSFVWGLLKRRIPQVAAEFLFATAVLAFSSPIHAALLPTVEASYPGWTDLFQIGYWVFVALLSLVPLVALTRNINALAMIVGESLTQGRGSVSKIRRLLIILLRTGAIALLGIWVLNLLPLNWLDGYMLAVVGLAVVATVVFSWRLMVRLHSEFAFSLSETMSRENPAEVEARTLWEAKRDWGFELEEWTVGAIANLGKSIGDLQIRKRSGATVVGLERQGCYLASVGPETHLYPGDRLYVVGSPEQLAEMRRLLSREEQSSEQAKRDFSLAILKTAVVQRGSACEGKTLRELQWPRLLGVQVVSQRRSDADPIPPNIDGPLVAGDSLLLVGSPRSLARVQLELTQAEGADKQSPSVPPNESQHS